MKKGSHLTKHIDECGRWELRDKLYIHEGFVAPLLALGKSSVPGLQTKFDKSHVELREGE